MQKDRADRSVDRRGAALLASAIPRKRDMRYERPMTRRACDVLLDILRDEGITHVFGNPGSTEMPLMDALVDAPDIKYVLGLQRRRSAWRTAGRWPRGGWAYDEIAREERLTAARVRQIVSEVLQKRQVDDSMAHALLQLSRLGPAVQLAGEAVARGDLQAIWPLLGALDRLDRYQKDARAIHRDNEEIRHKLYAKIARLAEAATENTAPVRSRSRSRKNPNPSPPPQPSSPLQDAIAAAGELRCPPPAARELVISFVEGRGPPSDASQAIEIAFGPPGARSRQAPRGFAGKRRRDTNLWAAVPPPSPARYEPTFSFMHVHWRSAR